MNILSVCQNFPTKQHPIRGLFVLRRLEKLAQLRELRVLVPQPWFPILRPREPDVLLSNPEFVGKTASMLYVPAIGNQWNGRCMQRCVGKWLDTLGKAVTKDAVLDAHFGYPEGVGCYLAARERGIPVFITIRGLEVDLFNKISPAPRLIEALREAAGVIAVSHSLKNAAVAAGVPESQIVVIQNGVDTKTFCQGNKDLARAAIGYHEPGKLIVSVGNLKPIKGHDILIRAFASMKERRETRLVCIGGGVNTSWGKNLQELVNKLGVRDQVHFVGTQLPLEVANWLRAADLFALASRREGCCNSVLEALSTGLPVAATDAGDNNMLVRQPQCGRIVATEDPDALANAILECLGIKFDRHFISQSVQNYTWQATAEKVIATFKSRTT